MATYSPSQVGVTPPSGGFQQGGWYNGRQYWGGTLGEPGVIHPSSNQQGAGQAVSAEVNAQSAQAQGVTAKQLEDYLAQQRQVKPTGTTPTPGTAGWGAETGANMGDGLGMEGLGAPAPINLPDLYKNLYQTAGIEDLNKQYSDMEKSYIETKGKINDNPFLSEATRVGRIAKLESLFNERTANIKNDIATKKADIETQLNLQTKQFDINSQTAKDNLDRLNVLLDMGALAGASGEDIANLTRLTGISSSAIYSAIRAKQEKDVETQIITSEADDGTVTATVVNTKTGAVISSNNLGKIGNKQTGGAGATKEAEAQANRQNLITDIKNKITLKSLINYYGGVIDIGEIYRLYNQNSPFGQAKETLDEVKEGLFNY